MLTSPLKFLQINFRPEEGEGMENPTPTENNAPSVEDDDPPAPAPQMVPVDIMQRRIAALTKQKADLERQLELERLEREIVPGGDDKPAARQQPQAVPDVLSEAQIIAENMRREEKAQAVLNAGQEQNKNFLPEVQRMSQVLGQLPNHFLDAVMEAGDSPAESAALLYKLSQDLNLAGQILTQSPTKMAVSLAKLIEKKKQAPTPASSRNSPPAPIKQKVGAGASPDGVQLSDTKSPISDWMAERERTAQKRRRF